MPPRSSGTAGICFDAQVHLANPDLELVEHGQLLALYVPGG